MIDKSIQSKERITEQVLIKAYINYPDNPEVVAEFSLGLSLKYKGN